VTEHGEVRRENTSVPDSLEMDRALYRCWYSEWSRRQSHSAGSLWGVLVHGPVEAIQEIAGATKESDVEAHRCERALLIESVIFRISIHTPQSTLFPPAYKTDSSLFDQVSEHYLTSTPQVSSRCTTTRYISGLA
jgi:hypothetical protein